MRTEAIKFDRDWLKEAFKIEDNERRGLLLFTCLGKALSSPQYKDVNGFVWPEVQDLWERTLIIPSTQGKDGLITWKKKRNPRD